MQSFILKSPLSKGCDIISGKLVAVTNTGRHFMSFIWYLSSQILLLQLSLQEERIVLSLSNDCKVVGSVKKQERQAGRKERKKKTWESLVSDVKTDLLPDIMNFPNRCFLETNKTVKP